MDLEDVYKALDEIAALRDDSFVAREVALWVAVLEEVSRRGGELGLMAQAALDVQVAVLPR